MNVRIYVADPNIRHEQIAAIEHRLPVEWSLVQQPVGASAILTQDADITFDMLSAAGGPLLLIGRLTPGTARVASTAVPVVDLANTALISVAEHAIMLMLALSRHLLWVTRQTAARQWRPDLGDTVFTDQRQYKYNWVGLEDFGTLYGKVVGIVGLGNVGRAVAQRLRVFGVQLLYTQRHRLSHEIEHELDVNWRELDDLLREADFVSLHLRYQEGAANNDQQFGDREFSLMKPTAYFVNTSRGRMVDEFALARALEDGRLAGAGLDVFRYEPLPADNPLVQVADRNLVITPHVAGAPVTDAWETAAHDFLDRLTDVIGAGVDSSAEGR